MGCNLRSIRFLIGRNLTLFFENRKNLWLSLSSMAIVLCLYFIFLRDFLIQIVLSYGVMVTIGQELTDRLMIAGLLIIMSTTTCFGMIQLRVKDSETGIYKDYLVAPISDFSIFLGYLISSTIVSSGFSSFAMLCSELYFNTKYHHSLSMESIGKIVFLLIFSALLNSSMLLCATDRLKSTTTFTTFANLYGTVIGFLTGAYLPYSFYDEWLRKILIFFPLTQLTSLIRQLVIVDIKKKDWGQLDYSTIYDSFGVQLTYKDSIVSSKQQWSWLLIVLMVIICYLWKMKSRKIDY